MHRPFDDTPGVLLWHSVVGIPGRCDRSRFLDVDETRRTAVRTCVVDINQHGIP
ncbi:MAG: hypothetical protein JWQ50_5487, partial [Caballeronia mineralivorans]|nr:hypothetical protein [Caballeronia mineralivorans]